MKACPLLLLLATALAAAAASPAGGVSAATAATAVPNSAATKPRRGLQPSKLQTGHFKCGSKVCLSLGVETVFGVMETIVSRGTALPAKGSRVFTTYRDNQVGAPIKLFEGERSMTSPSDFCRALFQQLDPRRISQLPSTAWMLMRAGCYATLRQETTIGLVNGTFLAFLQHRGDKRGSK